MLGKAYNSPTKIETDTFSGDVITKSTLNSKKSFRLNKGQ